MKTKIKSHGDEVTDFYDKKIAKVSKNPFSLDSALKKDENYNLQVFLKECKDNEKKVNRHINDDLSKFLSSGKSDNSDKK